MVVIKNILFLWLLCFTSILSAQYIQVNDTYSAQQLVTDVLIDSPCAGVSNFSVSGDPFSGTSQSYGYFTNTSPNFPFANGIVLSTARAIRSEGPNDNLIDEGSTSWGGDADLENLILDTTINATILEFDFTPLTSQVSFDYLFASEEYHGTATCTYSDAFAFLLKVAGSSDNYQNLAVIPNTNTPVSVTNIHPEIPGGCPAMNEAYFGSFNGTEHPINYSGQTVVMTAKATVIPGTTYHIKLVIADEDNYRYDSAIFLGGGSFSVGTDIGPDRLVATNNPVCAGDTYLLDATEAGTNTYQWFKNDIAIPGATNPTYPVTDAGTYSVIVYLAATLCEAKGKAVIEYANPPVVTDPQVLVQCDDDNDGITTFDLTKMDDAIGSQYSVAYYANLADAQNGSPIQNPGNFQNTAQNQVIAGVSNSYGCTAYVTVNLQISNNPIPNTPVFKTCDADDDGLAVFDLANVHTFILQGLPAGLAVQYYLNEIDAITQTNPITGNSFSNTVPFQQTIYALVLNGPDCYGIVPVTFMANVINSGNFQDEDVFFCQGSPVTLSVTDTFPQYSWSNGDTNPTTAVDMPGIYTVTVTDANGCSKTKTFNVSASGIGTITTIDINDFSGNDNTILVHYSGIGDYEFSLDGIHFQSSPLFTGLSEGEYAVYINDRNGCGMPPPTQIYVMDYPKFFTPNGDGYNDFWEIRKLDRHPLARVRIFDRYGKLVYSFSGNGVGWDGKLNGASLPSTDYWFTVTMENGRNIRRHFSLKR